MTDPASPQAEPDRTPKAVEFHFDFGSPNAYLAHRVLPELAARTGAEVVYVPVLLGGIFKATGNRSPFEAFAGVKAKMDYERIEIRRFIARHRLTAYRLNPFFPVNTLMMMRGAVAAQMDGLLAPYAETCFRAMWEDEKKMDDPDVFRSVLDTAGLDGGRFLERSQDPAVKERLLTNTQDSVGRGTFGIPTFFVGRDIYFGKDRLRDVEEALAT
ncbi:2-hydroxychromene-2-carboxylate isomerase [Phreatobacter sp.]|uniref:2-hydroxychromene-2-carboxylate isomerase n=1 Tax=Phreatobacter sp. TaxID=1966341 RepID=UPI003F730E9D